jgi:hypothetical protein
MLRQDAEAHHARTAALRALIGQRMEEPSEPLEGFEDLVAAMDRLG